MQNERLETICARLCLLSSLERAKGDPQPLSRIMVRKMLSAGALCGLVIREDSVLEDALIARARALLGRVSVVYESYERYCAQGYQVLLAEAPQWPMRLQALDKAMPLYLFAKGNLQLLEKNTIAVAGSRDISLETKAAAETVGREIARLGEVLVCGGARGVDTIVQKAALEAGGSAILVPAIPVHTLLKEPVYQAALDEGRLLILCETPPDEAFSAGKALARNHSIYALGNRALVVAARKEKGGSWAGACDCLRGQWSPVYALDADGDDYRGNQALFELGARQAALCDGKLCFETHGKQAVFSQMTLLGEETTDANTD